MIDVVYTWVDDRFPGYLDELRRYARSDDDVNPNRTRDNLDLLKYSLRSLAQNLPWVNRVWLISARPQVPSWLDRDAVEVVHHDAFMEHLPTFNSFAIVSSLYKIPGVSRRFLYVEDDRLFLRPIRPEHLLRDGKAVIYARRFSNDDHVAAPAKSAWNRALSTSDSLLDERYGPVARPTVNYGSHVFDVEHFSAFVEAFRPQVERTWRAKFRDSGTIAPEWMYPWFLLHEGLGIRARWAHWQTGYVGLGNWAGPNALRLAYNSVKRPRFLALNDNFEASPNPRAEAVVRRWLHRRFPTPSRYERMR